MRNALHYDEQAIQSDDMGRPSGAPRIVSQPSDISAYGPLEDPNDGERSGGEKPNSYTDAKKNGRPRRNARKKTRGGRRPSFSIRPCDNRVTGRTITSRPFAFRRPRSNDDGTLRRAIAADYAVARRRPHNILFTLYYHACDRRRRSR